MRIDKPSMDTLIEDCEVSVRTLNVCSAHGVLTIGDAKAKADELLKHVKGFGRRGYRELTEVVQWAEEAAQPDLLNTPEYRAYRLEDTLITVEALIQDVHRGLTRAALKGVVSADTRNHMKLKLLDAAERVMRMPTYSEEKT